MQLQKISEVIIPSERQRKEFPQKKLDELATSIKAVGLLHPIVLRDDSKTLVAGERRLRVLSLQKDKYAHNGLTVEPGLVPYVRVSELSADDLFIAEFSENTDRDPLSWQDQAKALKRFHEIQLRRNPQQTVTATAAATNPIPEDKKPSGRKIQEVSNALLVAEFLNDPEVAAQLTQADALKVIREQQKHVKRAALAAGVDFGASPHKLFNADAYEDAPKRYPSHFDCIVTDPPYGIDAHAKDTFDASDHEYDDSDAAFSRVVNELPSVLMAITKPNAHVYVFCDIRRFNELFVGFELGGWTVWHKPLIWDKGNTGSYGNIDYGPRACYDAILYARRGDKKCTAGFRDVISIPQPTNLPHPAGKPVELYAELIRRSCFPGEAVGDLFAGHGPIFGAATKQKVYAVGWELNPKYHVMSQESLAKTLGGSK
jgi:DNA modification methylase